jgi:ACR3 family arsenite efflux pump ArsB
MFASQGALLLDNIILFIKLLPPLLIFTKSARNSPVSLAIATITFPLQPVISLVLVMGPLIELPILAINSIILKNIGQKKWLFREYGRKSGKMI